jgi:DNA-binding NarL/FixJ family response regulator
MSLRCVIVDDNQGLLRAATALLEAQGVSVVGVATTGGQALALMEEQEPDVMLIDVDLGPESGFDLARRVSRHAGRASPCVILISTHDEADYAHLIASSPAIGFVSKSALSATAIRRLIERRGT